MEYGDKQDMGVVNGHIYEVSLKMSSGAGNAYNVFQYSVVVPSEGTDGDQLAQAWWNHVKGVYRALVSAGMTNYFRSVVAKDLSDPTGLFGEYGIPVNERSGTRTGTIQAEEAPAFCAVGIRLNVASRVTRPGQKRLGGLVEDDLYGQSVGSVFMGLAAAWADVLTADLVLGAPAALVTLRPAVVRRNAMGAVVADQPVTGYFINPNVTSQVSRKIGRGE